MTKKMQGDPGEAQSIMEKVVEMRRQSAAWDESNAATKIRLLLALAHVGDVAEGVKIADELNIALEKDDTARYDLACGFAQLAERVDSGEHSELPTKEALTEKALGNLAQSLSGGFSKEADLQMDPDLAPLRKSPKFEKLIAR